MSWQVCASCFRNVEDCTCNGRAAASQPVADYITIVEADTVSSGRRTKYEDGTPIPECGFRCMVCYNQRKHLDYCYRCKNYPQGNEWDDWYRIHGRRRRDDPNALRDGEDPLPAPVPYECPVCGQVNEGWMIYYNTSGYSSYSFSPATEEYEPEYYDSDPGDNEELDHFECGGCGHEVYGGDLYTELYEAIEW